MKTPFGLILKKKRKNTQIHIYPWIHYSEVDIVMSLICVVCKISTQCVVDLWTLNHFYSVSFQFHLGFKIRQHYQTI